MANYANLLATIAANIYTNNNNEVTAAMVKTAVDQMVASLGAGYQFMGVAHPGDTPSGYSDLKCFWLASSPGTYANFGSLVVAPGEIAALKYDGSWSKTTAAQLATNVIDGENDLEIADNDLNVLARFSGGEIQTKNFDSAKAPKVIDGRPDDLLITDPDKHVLVKIAGGHIYTKYFASDNIGAIDPFVGAFVNQVQNNPFASPAKDFFKRGAAYMLGYSVQPLIIVVGQSNADGRAIYTSAPSWLSDDNYKVPGFKVYDTATGTFQDYDVLGMTGNMGDPAGSDPDQGGVNCFAFDPFFAHEYLADNPGKTLYMVRQTLGDVGIQDQPTTGTRPWTWQPDIDNIVAGCHSMCISLQTKLKNAIAAAKLDGVILLPIAILWHQGEHDATNSWIPLYKQNLSNLISWIRGILFSPELPFINAYINGSYSTNYAAINAIFDELAAEDDNMACVDMTGHYDMLPDNVHYNATGLEYMGTEMYNLFKNM